jgi:REP element-mobilizing transposase RayT
VPRAIRIQAPDVLYHVGSRGVEKRPIFDVLDHDRAVFLDLLERVVRECAWVLHAYCLMGNHFHLVLETPNANISAGMQWLKSEYATWFNTFHPDREGALFERRFWSRMALEDAYAYELSRYVVLNPVRAGLVRSPADWRWSSYAATVGLERAPAFLRTDGVLRFFGSGARGQRRYAQFVGEGVGDPVRAAQAVWAMDRV